jgi:lipopolysaccharide biosynthesis protein
MKDKNMNGNKAHGVAFYLPQFHPTPENDMHWGKSFTEWCNVTKALPRFEGHLQPHLPGEMGFYDLRIPEVMDQQAELARAHGVEAFCFYYYRFGEKRILHRPVDQFLGLGRTDIGFCYCWANESWTRAWDGKTSEVLLEQRYDEDTLIRIADDLAIAFSDPRHLRVAGAPVFLIYQVEKLPHGGKDIDRLRFHLKVRGFGEVHICAVQSWGLQDPAQYGIDAVVDFPPHRIRRPNGRPLVKAENVPGADPQLGDYFENYADVVATHLGAPEESFPRYPAVTPSWDNTPRRAREGHVLLGATPAAFQDWTARAGELTLRRFDEGRIKSPLLFVNAWNEWAEGAVLEPDSVHGRAYIEAFAAGLKEAKFNHSKR